MGGCMSSRAAYMTIGGLRYKTIGGLYGENPARDRYLMGRVKGPVKPLVLPSPLHMAVREKDQELIEKLLSENAETNTYNQQGCTPLHLACEMGRADLVRQLCKGGANVNTETEVDAGNIPPLNFAASLGHVECVSVLLQAGASVNSVDIWGNTALFKAVSASFKDCVLILLDNGANPNLSNKWGATPLQFASMLGDADVVEALLKRDSDVNCLGESLSPPPLLAATSRGHIDCVKALLQYGANPDACTYGPNFSSSREDSAIFYTLRNAVSEGRDAAAVLGCAELLVTAGCDMLSSLDNIAIVIRSQPDYIEKMSTYTQQYDDKLRFIFKHFSLTRMHNFEEVIYDTFFLRLLRSWEVHTSYSSGPVIKREYDWGICQAFISAGGVPTLEHLALIKNNDDVKDHQNISLLENVARNPRSLKHLCRVNVRESLAFNISSLVSKLPLPELLREYVLISSPLHYEV